MGFVNLSGTVTTGATAQTLADANVIRHQLVFFNLAASGGDTLWLNFLGGTAAPNAPGSIPIAPQQGYETPQRLYDGMPESPAISVYGATTGDAFTAYGH